VTDPLGTEAEGDTARAVRGGCWGNMGGSVRSASRDGYLPDSRTMDLGFRLALGHHVVLRQGQGSGTTGQEVATDVGSGQTRRGAAGRTSPRHSGR